MKRAILSLVAASVMVTGALGMAENNGASGVRILAPNDGAVVGDTFELKYELKNAGEGRHAHVYQDGRYIKGFKGTFQKISKGNHEVTVRVATHDHEDLPASDTVRIVVE
jgi:hypothetical protein